MKTILSIILASISLSSFADSSLCKTEVKYKGINCCIEEKSCKEKIDSVLSQGLLDQIKNLNKRKARYDFGEAPNCYWAALSHTFGADKNPPRNIRGHSLDAEFSKILKKSFTEISRSDLRVGDLVVFYSINVRKRVMNYEGNSKVWWSFPGTTQHAAIWLGDNKLFQKEGTRKDNFSISTMSQARDYYEKSLNSMNSSGNLKVQYFKAK